MDQKLFIKPEQFVQIKDTCSEFCAIKCGVPQGSTLGPLLLFYM